MTKFEALAVSLKKTLPGLELLYHEPMSRHTTFHIGGPVPLMAIPGTEEETAVVFRTALDYDIIPYIVGNGSNLLVNDAGAEVFVIKTSKLTFLEGNGRAIRAGCGVLLSSLAAEAEKRSLTGLEFAYGIPGSVGGAVVMNAGAYGGEMQNVTEKVRVLNSRGEIEEIPAEHCGFRYRSSVFQDQSQVVLSVLLRLSEGKQAEILEKMESLMTRRREKQPLEYPSAGSVFKRPEGYFAAALIDQCHLKGRTVGGAQVSEKHAGFIINRGNAVCRDVLELMDEVQTAVQRETGVELEPEIRYLK